MKPRSLHRRDVRFGPETRHVERSGATEQMTAKDYEVLEFFLVKIGSVVRRVEVLNRAWDTGSEATSQHGEVDVKTLRRKLGNKLSETVRGLGYRCRGDVDD